MQSYDCAFGQAPGLEPQGASVGPTAQLNLTAALGGTTYCALAALHLCGKLDSFTDLHKTMDWLVHRIVPLDPSLLDGKDFSIDADTDGELFLQDIEQGKIQIAGFQGRPEKSPDACYSFWVGASLKVGHFRAKRRIRAESS